MSFLVLNANNAFIGYMTVAILCAIAYSTVNKSATNIYVSNETIRTHNYLTLFNNRFEYSLKDIERFKFYYSEGTFSKETFIIYFTDETRKEFQISVRIEDLKAFGKKLSELGFQVGYFH